MGESSPMISRRQFLSTATVAGTASLALAEDDPNWKIQHGRIKQSVVHWCFNPMPVEELAKAAAGMGMKSVELTGPEHWPTIKRYGLTCAIAGSHGFAKGFAHVEEHDECIAKLRSMVDASADFGCPSVITFSGFRRGISTEEGQKNMLEGLKKIVGYAEEKKLVLCLEMLNSRVNIEMKGHPDYFTDTIEMGVEICKAIGSPYLKMLFDIYHVQIMQGDVITRIHQFKDYLGHIHTAGNPGRGEIGATQEINYPPIMQALIDVGYQGYVGQEFIPTIDDKIASLREGVRICDV